MSNTTIELLEEKLQKNLESIDVLSDECFHAELAFELKLAYRRDLINETNKLIENLEGMEL
tara:strand:+ start:180 stop:362 length:183 start_codon:yes stop_codon:yes gene_type:complete